MFNQHLAAVSRRLLMSISWASWVPLGSATRTSGPWSTVRPWEPSFRRSVPFVFSGPGYGSHVHGLEQPNRCHRKMGKMWEQFGTTGYNGWFWVWPCQQLFCLGVCRDVETAWKWSHCHCQVKPGLSWRIGSGRGLRSRWVFSRVLDQSILIHCHRCFS